ncbi:MAG: MaoC/PaaZ C-terminal domain-containing protein [Pseudomonadota bacterium]
MAIDINRVRNWPFPLITQDYTEKDSILYALALGYGSNPTDAAELSFVYEQGLQAVPSMVNVLCHPGFWISDARTGIDASRAVHGEQHVIFHAPLAPRGRVRGQTRVEDVIDKGPGKGALLIVTRQLHDDVSGTLLASITQRTLCRGDGGFSSADASAAAPVGQKGKAVSASDSAALARPPNISIDLLTLPQAALLYRLSADRNPLHADPDVARKAGFPRPILHGLCTYGMATRAIITACCENVADRLGSLNVRFSAPVFPGEVLRTEIWEGDEGLRFRCLVPDRETVVISNGVATLRH